MKYLVILTGVIAVSFSAILIRFSEAPPLSLATYRMGFSFLMILPFYLLNKSYEEFNKKDLKLFLLTSLFLAFHFFTWITSLRYTSIMNSTVLVTLNPIFVAIFLFLLFKIKPKKYTVIGIILAILGSLVLFLSSNPDTIKLTGPLPVLGNTLALIGGMLASLYLIFTSILRKKHSLLAYVFPIYFCTFIYLLLLSLLTKTPLFGFTNREYFIFFLSALIPQVIGHTSYNWALKYFTPTFIALTILGEPLGATTLGILLFKEIPSLWALVGATLIILAIIVSSFGEKS